MYDATSQSGSSISCSSDRSTSIQWWWKSNPTAASSSGAVRIRPVRLNGDCREAFLLNEPFRDLCSGVVKVVGSVISFPQQNETRISKQFHKELLVLWSSCQDVPMFTNCPNL